MGRRRGGRRGRRAANRARARSRAQASARKRVSARKAAGRKPSGANRSANRAAARARAQAAAKKRIAQKRTISQTKARQQQKMRAAAAARNKAFQQRKAAEAKARQQRAAARRKAAAEASSRKAAADRAKKAAAAKRAADAKAAAANSRKAAVDRARKAAEARKAAAAKKAAPANPTKSFGPVADGATYAKNITNYNMKYGKTPAIRAKAYEQSLDPKSFKGLSDGQTFGVGPVASGDAYARGLNTDNQNVENRLRQVRNLASTLTGGLVPGVRKLTDKEIADRRVKVAAQRQANFMGRKTGGKKSNQGMQIQPEPEIVEEIPTENTIVEESTPLTNLTEIQQDAYNTALENYNAGTGYSGQGEGTGFGNLSQEVIAALMAGNRGQKRFRYGTAKRRGSDSLLTRGSERFKGFTTTGQLNI